MREAQIDHEDLRECREQAVSFQVPAPSPRCLAQQNGGDEAKMKHRAGRPSASPVAGQRAPIGGGTAKGFTVHHATTDAKQAAQTKDCMDPPRHKQDDDEIVHDVQQLLFGRQVLQEAMEGSGPSLPPVQALP